MSKERIGIVGAGKIGSAIVRGVIGAGLVSKDQVMASDVSDVLRQSIAKELGIKVTPGSGVAAASDYWRAHDPVPKRKVSQEEQFYGAHSTGSIQG